MRTHERKHRRIAVERTAEFGIARPRVPATLLMLVYLTDGWIGLDGWLGRIEAHAHA